MIEFWYTILGVTGFSPIAAAIIIGILDAISIYGLFLGVKFLWNKFRS
jgi:hypothetical protein